MNTTKDQEKLFNDIRYFIPSWFKLHRRKAILLQLITLFQAAVIAVLGWSLVGPYTQAFDSYSHSVFYLSMSGGTGVATAIFFKVLPQAIWRCALAGAIFWWLGQQRKLLSRPEV